MASREVTQIRKVNGVFKELLCSGRWLTKDRVVNDITSLRHSYHVVGREGAESTTIHAVRKDGGGYLRTSPDPHSRNNLNNLPTG